MTHLCDQQQAEANPIHRPGKDAQRLIRPVARGDGCHDFVLGKGNGPGICLTWAAAFLEKAILAKKAALQDGVETLVSYLWTPCYSAVLPHQIGRRCVPALAEATSLTFW